MSPGATSLLPSPPRSPAGRGYPAEVVASVQGLVVEEGLSYREAAARSGLREGLVGEWARRLGWRRGVVGGVEMPPPPSGQARGSPSPCGGGDAGATDLLPLWGRWQARSA